MRILKSSLQIVDTISGWSGRLVSLLVAAMILIMTYEVILRYAFNAPTQWSYELTLFFFGSYCILGGAYTLLRREHVAMDVLYVRLSLKGRAILDLVTVFLFFLFCGVLLWYGWGFFMRSWAAGETTATPWNPVLWPVKLSIPMGAFLILLQGLAKFIRDIFTASTGKTLV